MLSITNHFCHRIPPGYVADYLKFHVLEGTTSAKEDQSTAMLFTKSISPCEAVLLSGRLELIYRDEAALHSPGVHPNHASCGLHNKHNACQLPLRQREVGEKFQHE